MPSLTYDDVILKTQRIGAEQPHVLAYLLGVDDHILNQDERDLLAYLGMVVFEMMCQGSKHPPRVKRGMLRRALEKNLEVVESCRGRGSNELVETVRKMLTGYGQPEVLRYILEAIWEDSEEGTCIRDRMKGMILIHLKTVLDCLDA